MNIFFFNKQLLASTNVFEPVLRDKIWPGIVFVKPVGVVVDVTNVPNDTREKIAIFTSSVKLVILKILKMECARVIAIIIVMP